MKLLSKSKNGLVKKRCIELIPQMFKYIGSLFDVKDPEGAANLKKAMAAIFDFIKLPNNKDRG